jgi:dTDP-4-dehydrorhamnose reductase
MKLLVLGSAGQLGGMFARVTGHEVVGLTRRDVDVTAPEDLQAVVERHRPDVVVNCTAYNNVDGAEDDARTALEVNALAVQSMAAAARRVEATLVHYSTDFVFDGEADRPYSEADRARPVSVYGMSKLLGEWLARDAPRAYVLRVESLFGGPQARSSVDRIVSALREGLETPVFTDRVVSPSYVEDVVEATLGLLARDAPPGLYHCVNRGAATWAEVGGYVADALGVSRAWLRPTEARGLRMRAQRPLYCALDNTRLEQALGRSMPTWQAAIDRYLSGG